MPNTDIPVVGPVLNKIFGSRNQRFVKRYTSRVDRINALEPEIRPLTDPELRERFAALRERRDNGEKIDELLVEVFAIAREVMDRAVGIRNIFNPEHAEKFDPSRLNAKAKEAYDRVKAEIDALEPRQPVDDLLGNTEPVPAWVWVDLPPELCEGVRELYPESRPPFRARPFDVQLIGGMVLSGGKIAEMKTGEGKTIVAPLATTLAWVERRQAHVVTVNDYLVQRDRDWTFPFFRAIGMTVGAIHPQHQQPEDLKRQMYLCDVVYGTTSEFGFDYLRDNMKRSVDQQVQRKREFAIVDEVDSVLIDEARTPLIISGPAHEGTPRYDIADKLARHLVEKQRPWQTAEDEVARCKERIKGFEGDIRQARDRSTIPEIQQKLAEEKNRLPELERARDQHTQYYEIKPERKSAQLSHDGVAEAQRVAGVGSFYVGENQDLPHLLEQSLRAHAVYLRDRDYIVMEVPDRQTGRTEPSIVIVDQNTGRAMVGRQWSDGLHQAIEAKEGVPIKPETQTVASVTVQNFFKMYKRLAGMTGTADTEAQEFHDIYSLDVVSIPTNKEMVRKDHDDLMFLRERDKYEGIVEEIKHFHDIGRPVLVGTTSVEKSELIARLLQQKHQVKHHVLNAKQHEQEANVVADAGQLGAVMIATNMAGRGTDIKLGSLTRKQLIDHWLRRGVCSRKLTEDATDEQVREDVFRKVAQTELKGEGLKKRDIEEMDFAELETMLLRHWAQESTWLTPKQIEQATNQELMEELDKNGRMRLHRVRWFNDVEDLGGLHVIGTERHESRRIDNQLRGRSGRQGDNGSSRFYVSLEDDLMKMFAGETTQKLLARMGMKEGDAIEHPWLSKNVERAQKKVEERNFQMRKNILEYDEIMENQRQSFYGLRQRVLEGRELRDLIFEYIDDAITDAAGEMLDREYAAKCAAEYATAELGYAVPAERLRGKDRNEVEEVVRRLAKDEAVATIGVTIGEYMPTEGSEVSVDFDSAGLVAWAKSAFNIEIDAAELREGGMEEVRQVQDQLEQAAIDKIEATPLPRLDEFIVAGYGAKELSAWVERKFGFSVPAEEIIAADKDDNRDPTEPVLEKARELYNKREVEYPVEFMLEMTMALARQDPNRAFAELGIWSKRRFGEEMTPEQIRSTPPAKIREQLVEKQRGFVADAKLEEAINEALAIEKDDDLDKWMTERYGAGLTPRMRHLDPEDREDAIRSRMENMLRTELVYLERNILLEVLDTQWKDHLYAMDQLRDGISFRAFSQQDPRIQYKREGSHLFSIMQEDIRDRVTDVIFKARLSPAAAMNQAAQQAQQAQRPAGGPGGPGARPMQAQRPPIQQPAQRPQQRPQPPAQPPAQPQNPQQRPVQGGLMSFGGGGIAGPAFDQFGTAQPAGKPAQRPANPPANQPNQNPQGDQSAD